MELVPILSTIILVGTAATFLLAVFAYIMYKWRERQERRDVPAQRAYDEQPHVLVTPRTEYVEPAPAPIETPRSPRDRDPGVLESPVPPTSGQASGGGAAQQAAAPPTVERYTRPRRESLFWEYTGEGFVPFERRGQAEPDEVGNRGPEPGRGSAWI